jgi:hypothetical protein
MEPEFSLPFPQGPLNRPYHERDQSNPYYPSRFVSYMLISFTYVLGFIVISFFLNFKQITPSFMLCVLPTSSFLIWRSNCTWRSVQIMKHLIMQPSPVSFHFIPLGPNSLLSTQFSNALSLCSCLSVMDQVLHRYRTTGKHTFLYSTKNAVLWDVTPCGYYKNRRFGGT